MKLPAVAVLTAMLCVAGTGCLGTSLSEDLLGSDIGASSADTGESAVADPGLELLGAAIAGLDLDNGLGVLTGLRDAGFSRRELALLALDVLAAQAELSPEEEFALQLTHAYIDRDPQALAELALERLLPELSWLTGSNESEPAP